MFEADNTLVAPLNVEAMCLGDGDVGRTTLVKASADFSLLTPQEYFPSRIHQFADVTAVPGDVGVHLHWALPPPVAAGTAASDGEGEFSFPPAPDCWLVIRHAADPAHCGAFVVESDVVSATPEGRGIAIPTPPTRESACLFLGRATPLAVWRAAKEDERLQARTGRRLTAAGWGDPAFAAYYPDSGAVFGFHDRLEGVNQAALTYVVIGWHRVADDDILQIYRKANPAKSWPELMEAMSWLCDAPTDPQSQRCVYRGAVLRIEWRRTMRGFAPDGEAKPTLALGNSVAESLTALAVEGNRKAPPQERRILERRILERLTGLNPTRTDVGAAEVETTLHVQRFVAVDGGRQWAVAADSQVGEPLSPEDVAAVERDGVLTEALGRLNRLGRQLDRKRRQADALRQRVRNGLFQLEAMVFEPKAVESNPARRSDIRGALRRRLAADMTSMERVALEVRGLEQSVHVANADVNEAMRRRPRHRIVVKPGPRYWRPRDPVVLIKDPRFTAGPRYRRYTPGAADRSLVVERLRVDPAAATLPQESDVARELAKRLGFGRLGDTTLLGRLLTQALAAAAAAPPPPSAWLTVWNARTFRPLYLKWEIAYRPAHAVIASNGKIGADALMDRWRFDQSGGATDSGELLLRSGAGSDNEEEVYKGVGLIDPHQADLLWRGLIARLGKDGADALLGEGNEAGLVGWAQDAVSHGFAGFHDRLLMLGDALRLPVADLAHLLHLEHLPPVFEDTRPGDRLRPLPRQRLFSPLRDGVLAIRKLVAVDIFGRTLDLDPSGTVISASLDKAVGGVLLPPRLCPPARLSFRLKSAAQDKHDAEEGGNAASPVCGWVVASRVENALMVSDHDGALVGVLRQGADGGVALIDGPKLGGAPISGTLKRLVDALTQSGDRFKAFLAAVDDEIATTNVKGGDRGSALNRLAGRPLALVRADLGLDLYGDLPPRPQSLDRLGPGETAGMDELRIPIRLGDSDRAHDGLVGFFISPETGGDGHPDFGNFWTASGRRTNRPDADPAQTEPVLRVAHDGQDRRRRLLLVMDPRAPVHADSGLLPVKAISLPSAHVRHVLPTLGLMTMGGPILTDAAAPDVLPFLGRGEGIWRWRLADDDGWRDAVPASGGPAPSGHPTAKHPSVGRLLGTVWLSAAPVPTITSE